MAGRVNDAQRRPGAVAAETDPVRSSPFDHGLWPVGRTGAGGVCLDVAERLDDVGLVAQPGVMAKLHFTPSQGFANIAVGIWRKNGLRVAAFFLATHPLGGYLPADTSSPI